MKSALIWCIMHVFWEKWIATKYIWKGFNLASNVVQLLHIEDTAFQISALNTIVENNRGVFC